MNARPLVSKVVAVCFCVLGVGVVAGAPAWAVRGHIFAASIGSAGSGNGQLKEPVSVAVSEATGDVYVVDKGNNRVEHFGSAGGYLGQFNGSGLLFGEGKPAGGGGLAGEIPTGAFSAPEGIAVDNDPSSPSFGDVYVADVGHSVIDKYGPTGAYVGQITGGSGGSRFEEIVGLAVDPAGVLWVYLRTNSIDSFSGAVANEFLSSREASVSSPSISGFAVDSNDNLYVKTFVKGISKLNNSGGLLVEEFDSLIHEPFSEEFPSGVSVDLATNDVYISDADGEHSVGRFSSGGAVLEKFGAEQLVHQQGLTVDSASKAVYVADAAANVVDVFALEPPAAPSVTEVFVSNVSGESATLQGEVDPHGVSSEYRFEYGPCASGPTCVAPVPDGQLGAEYENHPVSLHLQGLQPSTAYHFRLVAHNQLGSTESKEHTFTTQTTGTSTTLPDGRAWEMVSPPNKDAAALEAAEIQFGSTTQASVNGNVVSYTANGPTEDSPPSNRAVELTQLYSVRSAGGWTSKDINTPFSEAGYYRLGSGAEFRMFSPDLSTALVYPFAETTKISSEATELTPYLRHDATCEASPATCYVPLVTTADVAPGVKWATNKKLVVPLAATPDLRHVILNSGRTPLLPGDSEETGGLYEWGEGKLQLVTILPDEKRAARGGALGYQNKILRHAISDDGSRVVFEAETGGSHLFTRDMVTGKTVQVDAVEPGAEGVESGINSEPIFQSASSDGSKVFFLEQARLTVNSTSSNNSPDLYEFNVETGRLTDLTVGMNPGEHAHVQGLVQGASEDGSYVYFVADGVLAPGARPGSHCGGVSPPASATCNLYVRHAGVTTYIATLSGGDQQFISEGGGKLQYVTARVSPSGRWFAFMSDRSLTGYDNRDAISGEPDEEVFLYDAGTGRLRCASCNPTGARPLGTRGPVTGSEHPGPLVDRASVWQGRWYAGLIPGWEEESNTGTGALYQARYLLDSGRLFFNSSDALVPRDVNGTQDVYQYEPVGEGDCTSASSTFGEASGGCVGLISSGGSGEESAFMDASENGSDVFFLTAAKLRPEDFDNALDLYDARECTSSSPCLPVPATVVPPCVTGDGCKPAPSLQPSGFGAAPSATFSGAGNVTPASTRGVKSRSLTRKQKLTRALRVCHERWRSKRKRAVCVRQAHRRYAGRAVGKGSVVWRGRTVAIARGR